MPLRLSALAALMLSLASAPGWAECRRNQYGVYEDPACAAEALAKADKELNEVYGQLLAKLDDDAKGKLRAAQRAWIAFRDANSSFVYTVEGNGSAGRTVATNQREQQTRARVAELRSWLSTN